MKAALVIGDPCRLESIARFFGPNGVPLPMPPQEVVDTVVRALLIIWQSMTHKLLPPYGSAMSFSGTDQPCLMHHLRCNEEQPCTMFSVHGALLRDQRLHEMLSS